MQQHRWPLLLLVLLPLLAEAWSRPFLRSADLEIIDGHFVRLQIGNPERTYAFYLDLEYNGILMSRVDTELQSNSFEQRPHGERSDIFVLGSYALRLPYTIGAFTLERAVQLSSQQSPVGKIGLGPHSPLWRYWGNFSMTSNRIRLGRADDVGDDNTPILLSGAGYCENPDTGTGAGMVINFGILNLLLPHALSNEHPAQLAVRSCANPRDCVEQVDIQVHNQNIELISGLSFSAVDLSHDGLVHLGRRFFYDIHLFVDWSLDAFIISDLVSFDQFFSSVYTIAVLLGLIQWWLVRQHQGKERPEMEKALLFLLEILLIQLTLAHWVTNFFVFSWASAITELIDHWRAQLATGFIHSIVVISLILCTVLLYYEYKHVHNPHSKSFHIIWHLLGLANLCLPVLWSNFVQHHHILVDFFMLLFFATLLVLINSIIFMHAYLFGSKSMRVTAGLLSLGSYAFLCLCSVVPFYEVLYVDEGSTMFVIQYVVLICLFPALFIFMHALRQFALHHPTEVSRGESRADDFISQLFIIESELL